jgi:hypothetical protein
VQLLVAFLLRLTVAAAMMMIMMTMTMMMMMMMVTTVCRLLCYWGRLSHVGEAAPHCQG